MTQDEIEALAVMILHELRAAGRAGLELGVLGDRLVPRGVAAKVADEKRRAVGAVMRWLLSQGAVDTTPAGAYVAVRGFP